MNDNIYMTTERLDSIRKIGETVSVEFKRCGGNIEHDVYETVCSFSNRFGGDIFLGILDDGSVNGVPEKAAPEMIKNFISILSNPAIFTPTLCLDPEIMEYEGKTIIHIYVPVSGEVVSYKKIIYNRSNDSDVKVTSTTDIAQMYIRKQEIFTERKVYPYVKFEDLRLDLLPTIRTLAKNNSAGNHPWEKLSDEELLRSAGLFTEDRVTGQQGFNLAAVMLLGKDEVIKDVSPMYLTDALVKKVNTDRYDDRLVVETNLIESYDQLFGFAEKHLPDKFYLEDGKIRLSLRNIIVREMIVNTLMHREYTSGFQARFVIEKDKMFVENANRAKKDGLITPENVIPYPKNPIIANFFRNIGYSDKLGSGVRKLFMYSEKYSGADPVFDESDVFRIIVPLNDEFSWDAGNIPSSSEISPANIPSSSEISLANIPSSNGISLELRNKIASLGKRRDKETVRNLIIELCKESPKTKKQLAEIFQRDEEYIKKFYLSKMVGSELELTNPNNPTDPNQAYKAK